jgi:hypothetical protein
MKKYAVFYADADAMREAHSGVLGVQLDDSNRVVAMPKSRFTSAYHYVGTLEASNPEHLFAQLNDMAGPNPLGNTVLQNWVIGPGPRHTSMSVGDVAMDMDSGDSLICASVGWAELEIV